jgi:hypothetical protein
VVEQSSERPTGEGLLALAERCEQATGPDLDLERDIATALGAGACYIAGSRDWHFTKSIDAAMQLVPEGVELRIDRRASKGMRPAYASIWKPGARDIDFHANGHGQTPALALCAAALRARAQNTASGGQND